MPSNILRSTRHGKRHKRKPVVPPEERGDVMLAMLAAMQSNATISQKVLLVEQGLMHDRTAVLTPRGYAVRDKAEDIMRRHSMSRGRGNMPGQTGPARY